MDLFGRTTIYTLENEITKENVAAVVSAAALTHSNNVPAINYLKAYEKGDQPILDRTKSVRPEICNKIVENHASEITSFFSGYFLGESCKYIQRGVKDGVAKEIERLNEYMYLADKEAHDEYLMNSVYCTGLGYRMCLANPDKSSKAPFKIDICDPSNTFMVYKSGVGMNKMLACQVITLEDESIRYVGYTKTHYFETDGVSVTVWNPHTYIDIPIFEYSAYTTKMGAFEPVIGILDAINTVQSNRADGIEGFIQSLLVFVNCDVDTDDVSGMRQSGFVKLKTSGDIKAEIQHIADELDQQQTQTLIDCFKDTAAQIVGMPNNSAGLGGGSSGNVGSVVAWQGWDKCETRIKETERLYKMADRQFLRHVLKIISDTDGINLEESDVTPEFARHNADNLLVKSQSLINFLNAGVNQAEAYATIKVWSDPNAVALKSTPYKEMTATAPTATNDVNGGGDTSG